MQNRCKRGLAVQDFPRKKLFGRLSAQSEGNADAPTNGGGGSPVPPSRSASSSDIYNTPTQDFEALSPDLLASRKALFKPLDKGPAEPVRNGFTTETSPRNETEPATFNPASDPMPAHINRVKLIRQLGQGSMGVVYEGRDDLLDIPVALKVMRSDLLLGQTAQSLKARFLREAKLAIRLSHPNMVRLYDVGEYGGTLYMSYEFVNGGTLEELMAGQPGRRLDVTRTVKIIKDILLALAEANRVGIVHRDVKPANILLTKEGEAKVSDLGLAKGLFGGEITVTQPTMVVGTPAYMAPEQAIAGRQIDVRADLYSIGVMMFQMLTGRLPFMGTNAMEMLMEHQRTPAPDPCEEEPSIPRPLGNLILKLMEKDVDKRYQTPQEVISDLERICPLLPESDCPSASAPAGTSGHCTLRWTLLAFTLALITLGAVLWWR